MFSYLTAFLSDPRNMLIAFLLAFPGRMLAISAHEFAHAWVADKCGDPTARMLGRLTLNPLKHLDPLGFIMMIVLGIGWAKPVPVNPRNYRNYRKDDLLVSIAGVTMNLLLFVVSFIAAALFACIILRNDGYNRYDILDNLRYAASFDYEFIGQAAGSRMLGYVYEMLSWFVHVNIALAIFNLLPVPPLDGYHVLNDLVLRRDLFASAQAARTAMVILYVLVFSGTLSTGLGYATDAVMNGMATILTPLFRLIL